MKKNIIILISLILITLILVVAFKEKDLLIIGNTTYGLTIDGIESTTLPTSGNYYLTSYTCKNGSIITWNKDDYELSIKNFNSEKESCNLTFESNPLLNEMQVGDYVAYVGNNGCLNENGTTGTSNASEESSNSCLGYNANQSEDDSGYTYGYCYNDFYKYFVYGWRIAYIEDGKAHLISAGSPECRSRTSSKGNATQIKDLNTAALDYCNATYVDGGTCSSSNTWAMDDYDYNKLIRGYYGENFGAWVDPESSYTCLWAYSQQRCGYNNDLMDNGGAYYLAAYYYSTYNEGIMWWPGYRSITETDTNISLGLRPIIKLSSNVYVESGSGTMEDPYQIAI